MLNRQSSRALISLLIVFAAACSADGGSASGGPAVPNRQVADPNADLSSILFRMSSGGLGRFPGAAAVSLMTSTSGIARTSIDPTECAYAADIDGFACPAFMLAGVTHTTSFWLYDDGGASRRAFDMHDVASVRLVSGFSGTSVFAPGTSDELTGHTDLTMSGLRSGMYQLRGGSTAHEDLTDDTGVHLVSDMTSVANVSVPAGLDTYPSGGTVDITYHTTGPTTLDLHSRITFTGGRFATLATTDEQKGRTTRCSIDLSSGIARC
jgi:hypothetical protein